MDRAHSLTHTHITDSWRDEAILQEEPVPVQEFMDDSRFKWGPSVLVCVCVQFRIASAIYNSLKKFSCVSHDFRAKSLLSQQVTNITHFWTEQQCVLPSAGS